MATLRVYGQLETGSHTQTLEVTHIKQVPKGIIKMDSIWAIRRKRKIGTDLVNKYKARLNAHDGQ